MMVILIARHVWSELGGRPHRFLGRTVEVDGTPQLFNGAYIDIPITIAGQLRMVSLRLAHPIAPPGVTESAVGHLRPLKAAARNVRSLRKRTLAVRRWNGRVSR